MTLVGEVDSCEIFVNCYPAVAPAVQAGVRHSNVRTGCRRMACCLSTSEFGVALCFSATVVIDPPCELFCLGLHEVFWDDVAARLRGRLGFLVFRAVVCDGALEGFKNPGEDTAARWVSFVRYPGGLPAEI